MEMLRHARQPVLPEEMLQTSVFGRRQHQQRHQGQNRRQHRHLSATSPAVLFIFLILETFAHIAHGAIPKTHAACQFNSRAKKFIRVERFSTAKVLKRTDAWAPSRGATTVTGDCRYTLDDRCKIIKGPAGCRSSQACLWYGGSVPLDSAAAAKRVKGGGEVAAPLLPPECMDRARASGKDEPSAMAYCYFQPASCADVYSPMDRGARGDGKSDDSAAFLAAFNAACGAAKKANKRTVLRIPRGKTFLLNYVTMQGPCGPGVTIKLDGKIVAPENPPSSKSWPGDFSGAVLQARQAHGLWIVGDGEMDGRGDRRWWPMYHGNQLPRELKRPVLLDIFASYSVTLAGFKNRNPAGMHLNIFRSGFVRVSNVTVESPADSPNTDGIHIGSSTDVVVEFSNIHTGDDNISIEEGAHRVTIANIWGTAGHGISIGSLGAHGTVACVSDVTVRNVVLTDTDNGLRIKTYQGGRGLVKNIQFKNVLMKNIKLPIVIDQNYCDRSTPGVVCEKQTDNVAVQGVSFSNIEATTTFKRGLLLNCSYSVPCRDIHLSNVRVTPASKSVQISPVIRNVYGKFDSKTRPVPTDQFRTSGFSLMAYPRVNQMASLCSLSSKGM